MTKDEPIETFATRDDLIHAMAIAEHRQLHGIDNVYVGEDCPYCRDYVRPLAPAVIAFVAAWIRAHGDPDYLGDTWEDEMQ